MASVFFFSMIKAAALCSLVSRRRRNTHFVGAATVCLRCFALRFTRRKKGALLPRTLFPFSLPLSLILIHILVTFLVIMTTNSILSERQRDELQVVR